MKNNTGTDIDVGTKTDSENTFPINFQPLPKRFMVWDKFEHRFHEIYSEKGGKQGIFDIWDLEWLLGRFDQCESVIVQSTNLFDKDGKEIFEGSIVEANWGFNTGSTYLDYNMVGIVKNLNGVWCITENNSDTDGKMLCELNPEDLNILGHILSNPELVEEK